MDSAAIRWTFLLLLCAALFTAAVCSVCIYYDVDSLCFTVPTYP